MAKVLPVCLQQDCSIKNHHLFPFLYQLADQLWSDKNVIMHQTFQRESAFSFAILAISGHTIAFSLANAAESANTIGPNALLKESI